MNNQEKAIGIAESNACDYAEAHYEFGDLREDYVSSYEECKQSALEMAEWKDQQFKEYLEDRLDNAKKHFVVSRGDVYYQGMWEMLDEIINEFFGE